MKTERNRVLLTRRDLLRRGALGAAGLALGGVRPLVAAPSTKPGPARAKAVIQIWMWGGPSQIDTFDPKPEAGYDYCGPYTHPLETNVPGIRIGEELKHLARHADKFSIIRSMTHGINAHETASYRVQTGHRPGRIVFPCVGAVVSLMKGYRHGYTGLVPPYIVLTQPQGRFSEAGFLGPDYKPFATGGDPNKTPFVVEGIVAQGISDARQRARRGLLHRLDALAAAEPENAAIRALREAEEKAYRMMFGDARELFDLGNESDAMRDRYGRNTFGQSCLAARRLVEHGVPYVTINYKGWDTHKQHFETMKRKLPEMDQAMAALLEDLSERGLLEQTIVWWGGEFGRTPKVQWAAPWNGGRGHHGQCFSVVVAGGGFRGGRVLGASDDTADRVREHPVYPEDLIRVIYRLMGIDPDAPLPNPRGLDVKIMPASEHGDHWLDEILVSA